MAKVKIYTPTDAQWGGICNGNPANKAADTYALYQIAQAITAEGSGYIRIPAGMTPVLGQYPGAPIPTAPMALIGTAQNKLTEVGLFGGGKILLDDNFGFFASYCNLAIVGDVEFDYLTDFVDEPNFEANLGRNTGFTVYSQYVDEVIYNSVKTNRSSSLAIAAFLCDTASVIDCEVAGSKRDGIHISNVRDVTIEGSYSHDTHDDAIAVFAGDTGSGGFTPIITEVFRVSDCRVANCIRAAGLALRGVSGGTVTATTIDTTSGSGVLIEKWNLTPAPTDIELYGITLINVATGIDNGSDPDTVHGVTVGRDAANVTLRNTRIEGSADDGVYVWGSATGTAIQNNDAYDITGTAFPAGTAEITVSGNTVDDTESDQRDLTDARIATALVTGFRTPTADEAPASVVVLSATAATGITGYLVTDSATPPAVDDPGWSPAKPATFAIAQGTPTAYAWAKDADDNISDPVSFAFTIDLFPATGADHLPGGYITDAEVVLSILYSSPVDTIQYGWSTETTEPETPSTYSAAIPLQDGSLWYRGVGTVDAQTVYEEWHVATFFFDESPPVTECTLPAGECMPGSLFVLHEVGADPSGCAILYDWGNAAPATPYTGPLEVQAATLYWRGVDSLGNLEDVHSASFTVTVIVTWVPAGGFAIGGTPAIGDTEGPAVEYFAVGSPSGLTVPVTIFTAADNVGVSGYRITESSTQPDPDEAGWSATAPTSYTTASEGAKILYPWAKDAAGNVSGLFGGPAPVTFSVSSDVVPPAVDTFTVGAPTGPIVAITAFTATDDTAVTGYKITESSTPPSPASAGWSANAPTSYTTATYGAKNLYPWAKDAAGNVSQAVTPTAVEFTELSPSSDVPLSRSSFNEVYALEVTIPYFSIVAEGVTLAKGAIVRLSAGVAVPASSDDIYSADGLLLIAPELIVGDGLPHIFLRKGKVGGFANLVAGQSYFLGSDEGTITRDGVSGPCRIVGIAWSSTQLFFDPSKGISNNLLGTIEDWGAKGDDPAFDDRPAFLACLAAGKSVVGTPGKTYYWSEGIVHKPIDGQGFHCDGICTVLCAGAGLYLYGNAGDFSNRNSIKGFLFRYTGTPTTWTFGPGDITVAAGGDKGYITKATTIVDGDILTITGGDAAIAGVMRGRAYYAECSGDDIHLHSLYDSDGFDYPSTISGVGSGTYTLTLATIGVALNGVRHYSTDRLTVEDFPLGLLFTRENRGSALGDSGGHYGNHNDIAVNTCTCGMLNTHEANQQTFKGGSFMGNIFHMNSSGSVNTFDGTAFEGANGVDELGIFGSTAAVNGGRFEKSGVGGRWAAEENVDSSMLFSFNGVIWGGGARPTAWGEAAVIAADTNANELTLRGLYPAVVRAAASSLVFSSAVAGDAFARIAMSGDGKRKHGDGAAAAAINVLGRGGCTNHEEHISLTSTFTATSSGVNMTVSGTTETLHVGDVLTGTGITGSTTISSQTSGPTGGDGVYVTAASTTCSGATVTATTTKVTPHYTRGYKKRISPAPAALTIELGDGIDGALEPTWEIAASDSTETVVTFSSDYRVNMADNQLTIPADTRVVLKFTYNTGLEKMVQQALPFPTSGSGPVSVLSAAGYTAPTRANNTVYANDTGRALHVIVSGLIGATSAYAYAYCPSGTEIDRAVSGSNAGAGFNFSFIVKAGQTYKVNAPLGSIYSWKEEELL